MLIQSGNTENLTLEEKRKLLMQLLEEKKAGNPATWPLSVGQQALWFLYQSNPSATSYNTGFALRILSPLRPEAWHKAVQHLFSGHPLLSAVFTVKNGTPVCMPFGGSVVHFETVDASSWSELQLYEAVVNKYQQPFQLTTGPVARCYLFTRSEKEHVFLFSVHHIIYDDGSTPVILKELICRYLEACGHKPDSFQSNVPKSFYDYVLSEKMMLTSERGNAAGRFWQEQLQQVTDLPSLQAYKNFRETKQGDGHTSIFTIEGELYKKLKETAGKEGFTPFVWLLTAFQLLVHTYTGSAEAVIGIPASVRDITHRETVGYFVNPLPVKSSQAGKKNFLDCLKACASSVGQALQYKDYPFARMVEQSGTERTTGRHPLFQIAFNYLNHTGLFDGDIQQFLQSAGLYISEYVIPTQESAFDITFELKDNHQSVAGTCKFNAAMYEPSFVELLCRHYIFYLEQSLENPGKELRDFQWVLPEEKELLKAWNDTAHRHSGVLLINGAFAGIAYAYPQKVAVAAPDARLTYKELDERSNQLAHFIGGKLNGKGKAVGLVAKPGVSMIVGIMGILKAGAAYVPVDPDFPESRIHAMLQQAGCRLVLYGDGCPVPASGLPDNTEAVDIQSQWPLIATLPLYGPDVFIQPDDPAYILFTSGSTGQPKGVMGLHKSVVNLVKYTNYIAVEPDDNFLLISNYVFDGSIFEIFGALLNGATLHILPAQTLFSPSDLFFYIRRYHINTAFLSTAFFNHLVDTDPSFVAHFDTILFGGEPVSIRHVLKALPYCKKKGVLRNAYGPTECTTFSLSYPVPDLENDCKLIPVGKPHTNVKAYVLDEHLKALPVGVAGELYIGGMGLSGGYINQPDLTAARFIASPWCAEEMLYASGDFACWLPGGNIHFIGRRDHQVKVRGYRIELGEIEAAMGKHPKVNTAVVLCTRSPEATPVLTAFAATGEHMPDARELTAFLSSSLPHYMIPHQFHFLPAFPLNENGKVDRKKLHQLIQFQQTGPHQSFVPPATELQHTLADIWQEVLKKKSICIHDNFFELGGHSLLAAKIIFQVKDKTGVEVPVSSLFMKPTIYTMSKIIEEQLTVPAKPPEPELVRVPRQSLVRKSRQE